MGRGLTGVVVALAVLAVGCCAAEWSDDFDGALKSDWEWVREVSWNWTVSERVGYLRIFTERGGLLLDTNNARNLLLREAPSGDYTIQTYVEFEPTADFQMAGLLIYDDDDNFLMLGRAYCARCGGNKIYFDYEEDGESLGGEWLTTPTLDCAYLKIVKQGSTYSGYYKEEDSDWTLVGQYHDVGVRAEGVGLAAFEGSDTDNWLDADFAYFLLKEEEEEEEEEEETAQAPSAPPVIVAPPTIMVIEVVDIPSGPVYASRVVECVRCSRWSEPEWVLGPPCGAGGAPRIDLLHDLRNWQGCWVGLDYRGRLVVEMEHPFTDGPGVDLRVYEFVSEYETGPGSELVDWFSVAVSADGENWVSVASNVAAEEGGDPIGYVAIDLAPYPGTYRFVKVSVTMMLDWDPFIDNPYLGTEVLAIEALYPTNE